MSTLFLNLSLLNGKLGIYRILMEAESIKEAERRKGKKGKKMKKKRKRKK